MSSSWGGGIRTHRIGVRTTREHGSRVFVPQGLDESLPVSGEAHVTGLLGSDLCLASARR